jgi:hypothetical protein
MSSAASIYVATSLRCDRETCELGEDFPELLKVERAARMLEQRLARAARHLSARPAIDSVTELNLLLADARHDSSFDSLFARAEDAFGEARVVRMRQKPIS